MPLHGSSGWHDPHSVALGSSFGRSQARAIESPRLDPYRGYYTAYSSARAAVLNFTKGLGRELASHNIQVNAIAQNYVENPNYFPPELIAKPSFQEWLKEQVPTGRLAKPWEQAKLAAFLVSEDADFLVGAVIPFAGGDTL